MADLYISSKDGWTHIGETFADPKFEPQVSVPDLAPFARLAGLTVSLTADVAGFTDKLNDALWWLHDLDQTCYPRKHRRCHVCHPKWSRPLAVDGHEYRRRQLARQGRRRRA